MGGTSARSTSDKVPDALLLAIRQAAGWYARLNSGAAGERDQREWRQWLAADPLHEQAWQRIEGVQGMFGRVPGKLATQTLAAQPTNRRAMLQRSLLGLAVLGVGAATWRLAPWEAGTVYRTATGERLDLELADGSMLYLNTGSVLRVVFDAHERRIELSEGEIQIQSGGHLGENRPLVVYALHGRVTALGTRFSLRVDEGFTTVAVQQAAVMAQGREQAAPGIRLEQGQQLRLHATGVTQIETAKALADSWRSGSLTVVDMPLARLTAELGRYRAGILRCDPDIGHIKVSGSFLIDDTDRALATLAHSFPIRIETRTRYWVRIAAR